MNKNQLKQFYENQANVLGNKIISDTLKKKYNVLVKDILNNKPYGAKILDVGCQSGGLSIILSMLGFKVTALDISEKYLEYLKNNANNSKINLQILCGYAEDIDKIFENRYFDVIILSSILEHTLNYMEIYEKCKDRLREKGMIFINVPLYKSFYSNEHLVIFDDDNIKQFKKCQIKKIYYNKNDPNKLGWFNLIWENKNEKENSINRKWLLGQ